MRRGGLLDGLIELRDRINAFRDGGERLTLNLSEPGAQPAWYGALPRVARRPDQGDGRIEIGLCAAGVTETDTNRGAGPQRDAQVAPQSDHARLVLGPKQLPLQQLDGDVLITQSNLRVAESHGRRRALA